MIDLSALNLMDSLTRYYGSDWIGMVLLFVGIYLLGEKKSSGFIVALLACVAWLIFAILLKNLPQILLNVVLALFYMRGYQKWKSEST